MHGTMNAKNILYSLIGLPWERKVLYKVLQVISYWLTSREYTIHLEWNFLCIIFLDFAIFMKLVSLIQLCLNITCSEFHVGTSLSCIFLRQGVLKQGDGLSPWLCNFVLYVEFRNVQVNQHGSKVNGTLHVVVYTNVDLVTENVA